MDVRFASLERRLASDLSTVIATIAAGVPTIHVMRGRRVVAPKFSLDDFLLRFGDNQKPPTPAKPWQQLRSIARSLALAFNKGNT